MKVITNILLIAALMSYVFLPLFEVEFAGVLTGFSYSAEAITTSDDLATQVFALMPFVSCFMAIAFNCLKNRYWGFVSGVFIALGLAFYFLAKHYVLIQSPEIYSYEGIGVGFIVGYVLMICALASTILSVLPFHFNMHHEKPAPKVDVKGKDLRQE